MTLRYLICMPLSNEASLLIEFPVGHVVLALFPSTTCLYRAIVVSNPSKANKVLIERERRLEIIYYGLMMTMCHPGQ